MAEGHVVGIDLGTTNSLVAYMEGDKPVVIPGVDGSNLVPSVVALDPMFAAGGGRPTVTVGNSARKALIETPERVIYSVKRLMGRGLEEVRTELKFFPFRLAGDIEAGEVPRIQLGEMRFTPPEISAYVLRQLKRNASASSARRSRKRSSPYRRTSTTRSARPLKTQDAWRAWMCCG